MAKNAHVYLGLGLFFGGFFIAYFATNTGLEDRTAGPGAAIGILVLIAGVISLMTY
jgi:hypothetical protein